MNKSRVYIETTIPSFYYEVRTEPEIIARRQWTRKWWDNHRSEYELVSSPAVMVELEQGSYPEQHNAITLLEEVPLLEASEGIGDIVTAYTT